ncbi:MAG: helix-turn-helix domain-containing protein [Anaerolineaceae bacterium]
MAFKTDFTIATSEQIENAICRRIEAIRLSRNITRENLAKEAGVSERTIARLEEGKGVSFDTLIRVLIALRIQGNLETLLPDPSIRPMERIGTSGTERRRARPKQTIPAKKWTWNDEKQGKE